MADRFFGEPDCSVEGWERAIDAQIRIVGAVRAIVAERPGTATLFVGHGAVGTLLLSALGGMAISRKHDQGAGGGHWFAFDCDTLAPLTTRWQRMESAPCDLLRGTAA
jgi:broad specificity phosphatase PhoE